MCVVAHPDDECFAFGGALLLAKQAGFETAVICLTDGQAASNRGDSTDGQDLGRMRREEFARSCAVLGVTTHELLSYQDGQLEFESLNGVGRELVQRMRTWQPQIVVTFGTDGSLNVHPDHTAASCFASAAFHWAGRSRRFPELGMPVFAPQRLYHQSTSFTLPDRELLLPAPWTVELDVRAVKAQKEAAFHEHTSQLPLLPKILPVWERHGDFEHYTLAAVFSPSPAEVSQDLFSGIFEDSAQ